MMCIVNNFVTSAEDSLDVVSCLVHDSVTQLRCMAIFGCDVSNAPLPDVPVMVSRYWLARRHDTPPHVCRRRVITS